MKKSKLFWKKICVLLFSVLIILSFSFSSFASSGVITTTPNVLYSGDSASTIIVPIINSNYTASSTSQSFGSYSGQFSVNYVLFLNLPSSDDGFYSLSSGLLAAKTNVQITCDYRYAVSSGFYQNIVVSVADAYLIDDMGTTYATYNSNSRSAVLTTNPGSTATHGVNVGQLFSMIDARGSIWHRLAIMHVTYNVSSYFPLRFATLSSPSSHGSVSFVPYVGDTSELVQLSKINDKLQNLTDGYDKSNIDNTNQQLGNNFDSFDQAEDAAIGSVKDYFNDIEQPIDFFNVGIFLTSTSFVWTYLQGLYDHLGDAKIVVNVILSLTVAFSFIGLGRYIWKAIDRRDSDV